MNEDIVIPIAGMMMIIIIALGVPLVVAYNKRAERRSAARSPETDHRLERIEQAIDAMAVEVERISEGQRFVTRILSERTQERAAIPASSRENQ